MSVAGTLVLDNLNLKPEALVGLDLPIEVKAGHIGRLLYCPVNVFPNFTVITLYLK